VDAAARPVVPQKSIAAGPVVPQKSIAAVLDTSVSPPSSVCFFYLSRSRVPNHTDLS
jgi:hypothetical protein